MVEVVLEILLQFFKSLVFHYFLEEWFLMCLGKCKLEQSAHAFEFVTKEEDVMRLEV